jgi:hypothetical protein
VAVAGGMKFLLLRKNREAENGSTWTLFVTERTQRQDQRVSESTRPAGDGAGWLAGVGRHSEPLVVEPIPPGGDPDVPW